MSREQALRELVVKWRRLAEPYIATQTSEQHPIRCDLQVCADELEAALAEPQAGTLYTEGDTPRVHQRVHQKSIVEEAKEEMLRAASGEPTREVPASSAHNEAAAGAASGAQRISLCPRCEGEGHYNAKPCFLCNGSGRLGEDGTAFWAAPAVKELSQAQVGTALAESGFVVEGEANMSGFVRFVQRLNALLRSGGKP